MLSPSERRQLLAMMNMAAGLQNQIAALLGEDAVPDEDPAEPAHPGEVMGRRVFLSHVSKTQGAEHEPQAISIPDTAVRTGTPAPDEGIARPRGSRKRHSG